MAMAASASACLYDAPKLTGPVPQLAEVSPPAACNDQIVTDVRLSGDRLSPLPVDTLTDGTSLDLPQVSLDRVQDLDGVGVDAEPILLADETTADVESYVTWESKEAMHIRIDPLLTLTQGLYSIEVDNPNGNATRFDDSLLVVPPPTLTSVVPDLICADKANTLDFAGDFFIRFGDGVPQIAFDDDSIVPSTDESDCRPLPGTSGAEACRGLSLDVPSGFLATGAELYVGFDVVITNPDSVTCHSVDAVDLTAVPKPALTAVSPIPVCDAQGDRELSVTGVAFLSIDGATPTLTLGSLSLATAVVPESCVNIPGPAATVSSCTELTATIPQNGLAPGTYAATVTNPAPADCVSTDTVAFQVVPPPSITSVVPDLVCAAQGDRQVTVNGNDFLVFHASAIPELPIVSIDGTELVVTIGTVNDCEALADPAADALVCSKLTLTVPQATLAHTYSLTVTNPDPAGCTTEPPANFFVVGPPVLTSVNPTGVCITQADATLTVSGSNFLQVDGALPSLILNDGSADLPPLTPAPTDLTGCSDYIGPTETVRACTGFVVTVSQATQGLTHYQARVRNPQPAGCDSAPLSLVNYPPPTIVTPNGTSPATLCQGGGSLTVTGTNIRAGAKVRVGGVAAGSAIPASSSCNTDGLCTTLDVVLGFLPTSLVAASPVDLQVENSDTCTAVVADAVNVTAGPLLLYVDPPNVYDGFANELTVYATNFLGSADVTHVELIAQTTGDTLVLCDDGGAPTCPSLSGATSGWFKVNLPADRLALVTGTPDRETFTMRIQGAGAACDAHLPNAITIVAETTPATVVLSPAFGKVGNAVPVTITMHDPVPGLFTPTPRAYLTSTASGGPLQAVAFSALDTLTAIVPSSFTIAGNYTDFDLTIVNPDGSVFVEPQAFRLSSYDAPRIDNVTPGQVSVSGGSVVVTGSNFSDSPTKPIVALSQCFLPSGAGTFPNDTDGDGANDGYLIAAASVTFTSSTSLTFTAPAAEQDTVCLVRVENTRDDAYDLFSALVYANSSGNIPSAKLASQTLATGREGHGIAAIGATRAARFLYVVGGDTDTASSVLGSVEYAPLRLTGDLSGPFATSRYPLNSARTNLGLFSAGRAIYAVGGADSTGAAQTTVERAVVLDPAETIAVSLSTFTFGTTSAPGLGVGAWIYRVAIVYGATDTINPCGESLPSEPFVMNLPDVDVGIRLTLDWTKADVASLGSAFTGRVVAGYRIYRVPTADLALSDLEILNNVNGVSTLSYLDDGQPVGSLTTITGCSPSVDGDRPLALGATSKWVTLGGNLTLKQARKVSGFKTVPDKTAGSNKVFFYAMSGLDAANAGLTDYEVLLLIADPTQNPAQWEATAGWTRVTGALPNGTMACSGATARAHAGLFLVNRDNSSQNGASPAISDESQYLALGFGRVPGGTSTLRMVQTWKVSLTDGTLGNYWSSCEGSSDLANIVGYGNVAVNRQLFHFGGQTSTGTIRATMPSAEWNVVSNQLQTENVNYTGGAAMRAARYLHATTLDRAFIYVVGGMTGAGVTNTVELGVW
jgi:hypothetical protein